MATVGLKGIWGLEQLDRTGIATWKLGVLLMGGSALFGAMLIPILGEVNPDSVLATFYTPRLVAVILVFTTFSIGFFYFGRWRRRGLLKLPCVCSRQPVMVSMKASKGFNQQQELYYSVF